MHSRVADLHGWQTVYRYEWVVTRSSHGTWTATRGDGIAVRSDSPQRLRELVDGTYPNQQTGN